MNLQLKIKFFLLVFVVSFIFQELSATTLTVYLRNAQNNLVTDGKGKIYRYTTSWSPIDNKNTDSGGKAVWSGLSSGSKYHLEAYYNGPWGEEFWGTVLNASVPTTITITRNMPYCEQIVFKDDATNSVITSIPVNRRVRIEVTVINRAPNSHQCYVRVRLDRERDSSYDFNEASSQQSVSANGGSTTFILRFTPTQPGTYYRTLAVYTYIPGGPTDWDLTDSWLWNMAFDVMPLHEVSVPTVSGPTSGNVGVSYSFTASGASCSQGHSLQYQFDWGDGTQSSWGSATQSKVWGSAGTYGVRVRARCQTDTTIVSGWSSQISVVITATRYKISGYVRDGNNQGISEVSVEARFGSGSQTVVTDSNGYYEITWLPLGANVTITPKKAGWTFDPQNRTYTNLSSDFTNQNFTGRVTPAEISGNVKDVRGNPLSGLSVRLETVGGSLVTTVITGSDGGYKFTGLTLTDYIVRIQPQNGLQFDPEGQRVSVGSSGVNFVGGDSYEPNEHSNQAYGFLVVGREYESFIFKPYDTDYYSVNISQAGEVRIRLTSLPINLKLELYNRSLSRVALSDNSGSSDELISYNVSSENTGIYYIAVSASDITSYNREDSYLLTVLFTPAQGQQPLHSVSAPTTLSGPSTGTVNTSYSFTASGASCSQGHSLQYQFDWGDGTQSSWGSATQSKVWGSAGTYGVRVRARCQTDTTIVSGWSSQIFITISVFTGELSGTITDTSGEIISNAKITVSGGIESVKRTIYSTSSGGFLFTSLPIGDYILTVEKMGYQKYISTITITAGQRTIHNVKLIPDKFGPAINNIEINWSTNAVTVIASIEDISGVKEVKLWYKAVGQWIDSGRETLMENVFESSEDKKIYSVTVHFPYDYLQYRIKAYDNLGNETISAAMYQTRGIVPASKREYSFDDKLSYLRYNFEEGKLNDLYFSLLPSGYAMYLPTLMDPIFAEVVLDGFIKEHDYFGRGFKDDIARKVIYKTVLREILSEYSYQKDISENIIVRILEGEIEIIEIIGGTAEIGEYVINLGFFLKSHNLPNISIELIRSGIRIIPGSRKALQNLASLISKLKGGGTVFANYTGILIGLEELFGKIAMGASTVSFSMLVGEIFEKTKFLNNNKDTIMNRSRILQKIQDSEQVFKDSLEEVTNSLTMIDTAAEHWVEIGAYLVSVAQFAANLSGIANIGVGGVTIAAKDYLDIVENLKILCGLGTIYKKIEYALVNDFLDPTDKEYLNHLCKVIAYYYFRTIEKMRDKLSVKMIDFMKFQIEKLFSPANAELWSIYLDSVPERKKEMARKIINEITQPQLMEQTADAKKVMLLNSVSSEIVFENFKVVFPSNSLKSTEELNIAMVKIQKINLSGNMFITTNNQPIVCVDNGYNLVIESSVIKDTFHIKIRKNGQSWPTKELKIAYWSDLNSRPEILHQTTYSQGWYLSSSIRAGIYGLVQFLSPPSDPNNIIPPTQITNGRAVFIDKRTNSPLIGWKLQILTADPRRGGVLLFKKEYDEQGEMVWDEGVSPGHYIYQYFPTKNSKPIIGRFDLNPR